MLAFTDAAPALPPTGDFGFSPQVPLVGASVGFDATGFSDPDGGTIAVVDWNFGDGASATTATAQHAYATRGTKTVTLTVTDSGNESTTVVHTVRVNAPPVAAFTATPGVVQIAQPVSFDGSSSSDSEGSVDYLWDFGDGASATTATAQHAYATSGTYTITLSVTDSDGVTRSVQHNVRVNAPPTPRLTYAALDKFPGQDSRSPFVGERVAFSATSSTDPDGDPALATYEWDFNGDGVFNDVAPARSLITTLTTPGDVPVGLRMTDVDGATSTIAVPIHVDQPPVASFTFSPRSPVTGQAVQFTSMASDPDGAGDILSQAWDLNGDGKFDDASGPSVLAGFLTPGSYRVSLQVTDRTRVVATQTQTVAVGLASSSSPPLPLPSFGQQMVIVPRPANGASKASASSVVPAHGLKVLAGVRVSIAGSVAGKATRITRMVVAAPVGALVKAACRGPGCPAKGERRRARKGSVRLRLFERTYRAGAQIGVTVTQRGFIGKYILFTIRQGKAPVRSELCLAPGGRRAGRCPRT